VTEGLGRALARPTQPVHRPWSPSGRRRGSEVPVPRPRAWRSAAARLPAAAAGWAKSINPLLRHEVEDVHRLGSRGYQTGPSEPRVDEHGRATCAKWLMSQDTSDEVTMCSPDALHGQAHLGTVTTASTVDFQGPPLLQPSPPSPPSSLPPSWPQPPALPSVATCARAFWPSRPQCKKKMGL